MSMKKKVWLAINKEAQLTVVGHYLIYGSEFINELAIELGCSSSLKNAGIPTIFYCDIPLEDISSSKVKEKHPKEVPDLYYYNMKYRPDYK